MAKRFNVTKKKSVAPAPQVGTSFNGVDLTPPAAPPAAPMFNPASGSFADTIKAVQQQQNAANAANNQRYGQGLGVLTGGMDNARGFLNSAVADSDSLGTSARTRIAHNLQDAQGASQQSAISRGLYNTTVLDTLRSGNARNAEDANQQVDEQVANRRSALRQSQASNERSGADSISGFIANRNDVGPDLGTFAQLLQGAASDASKARRTGTVTSNGSGFGPGGTPPSITTPSAGGGSASPLSYSGNASGSSFGGGAGGGGSTAGAGGYFAGSTLGGATGAYAPLPSAPAGDFSQAMANAGMGQGSISITPTKQFDDGGSLSAAPAYDRGSGLGSGLPTVSAPAAQKSLSYYEWLAGPGKAWNSSMPDQNETAKRQYAAYIGQVAGF